jgi:hypothetical protein
VETLDSGVPCNHVDAALRFMPVQNTADHEQQDEHILAYEKWETVREQPNWSNVG